MKLKHKINRHYLEISTYVIFTCIVIFILSRMTDKASSILFAIGGILNWIKAVLKPVIIGFVIAYLLYPMLDRLEGWIRKIAFLKKAKGVRGLALALQFLILFAILFLLISILVSAVTKQATAASTEGIMTAVRSYSNSLNTFYRDLIRSLDKLNINSTEIEKAIDEMVRNSGQSLLKFSKGLGGFVINVKDGLSTALFAFIFAIYFLLDGKKLKVYWGKVFDIVFPKKFTKLMGTALADMDRVFSGYIRGQVIDAVMVGIVLSIALSVAGSPYALVIGFLVGLGNLVPYMGAILGYGSILITGLLTGDTNMMIISLIIMFVIQTLDGNVIYPKLISSSIDIHPMIVIIALTVGAKLGGLLGMIVAVPCGALVKIWFERLLRKAEGMSDEERVEEKKHEGSGKKK